MSDAGSPRPGQINVDVVDRLDGDDNGTVSRPEADPAALSSEAHSHDHHVHNSPPDDDDNIKHNNDNDNDDAYHSELSELDEDQFDDYDPTTADIRDRPVAIDADAAQTLKASKRKRAESTTIKRPTASATTSSGAPSWRRRRRDKRPRRDAADSDAAADSNNDDDDDDHAGDYRAPPSGPRRQRRRRVGAAAAGDVDDVVVDESLLDPAERRRLEISRAFDSAVGKKPTKRRTKKDEIVRVTTTTPSFFRPCQLTYSRTSSRTKSTKSSPTSKSAWRRHARPTTPRW